MNTITVRVTVGDDGEIKQMSPPSSRYTWDQKLLEQKLALLKLAPLYADSSKVPGIGRRRARYVFYVWLYDGEYQHLEE